MEVHTSCICTANGPASQFVRPSNLDSTPIRSCVCQSADHAVREMMGCFDDGDKTFLHRSGTDVQ
jgi:hypothetical protein